MADTEWNKVESEQRNAHNFKEVPELEGEYKEAVKSVHGGNDYLVVDKDGNDVLVWGKTALQTKMARVEVGAKVKIVYLGEKKSSSTGRTYEDYDVYYS